MKRSFYTTLSLLALAGVAGVAHAEDAIVAKYVAADDAVFAAPHPTAGPWAASPVLTVPLSPQAGIGTPAKQTPGPSSVDVRAAHNGKWLAVSLSWADKSPDQKTATQQFTDAVAVAVPLKDPAATSPFMGGQGAPVQIQYWKSLWQRDMEKGYQDITELYPNAYVDGYHGYYLPKESGQGLPNTAQAWNNPLTREANPALAAGSPMAQPGRTTPVEQLHAEGFGSLTTQKEQNAKGWGSYKDGRWNVVITFPLNSGDTEDVVLAPGGTTALNFAVWDGGVQDRGARKSYSNFTPLKLEAAP